MATKKKGQLSAIVTRPPSKPSKPKEPLKLVGGGLAGLINGGIENIPMAPTVPQEKDYWQELQEAMERQQAAQEQAIRDRANAAIAQLDSYKPKIEQSYQEQQKQAYIQNTLGQNQISEKMSAMGYSGGMSETTMGNLNNEYANKRAAATSEKESNLGELENRKASVYTDMNSDIAGANDNYYSNYLTMLGNKHQEDVAKKDKEAEKNRLAEVDKWNSEVMSKISAQRKKGNEIEDWYDSEGKLHYRVISSISKKEITAWNNKQQKNIAAARKAGYELHVWEDEYGKIHYQKLGKKKVNSSGGSSRSASSQGRSGGSASYSAPAKQSSSTKSTTKKKTSASGFNLARAAGYVNQNAAKLITNPSAVVSDVRDKVKAGKLSNDDANYILGKIKRKK